LCDVSAPDPPTFAIDDFNETWANITWEPSRSGTPGSVFYLQYRPRG
jgi:neuronal cell adhesion molecule